TPATVFRLRASCSNLPQIFPTWGPMFKSSADLSNLGPHVQIFRRFFQLGAPCSNLPQIFPTWGPMFKSSADFSNFGPHVQIFRGSSQNAAAPRRGILQRPRFSQTRGLVPRSENREDAPTPCIKSRSQFRSQRVYQRLGPMAL